MKAITEAFQAVAGSKLLKAEHSTTQPVSTITLPQRHLFKMRTRPRVFRSREAWLMWWLREGYSQQKITFASRCCPMRRLSFSPFQSSQMSLAKASLCLRWTIARLIPWPAQFRQKITEEKNSEEAKWKDVKSTSQQDSLTKVRKQHKGRAWLKKLTRSIVVQTQE